MIYRKWTAFALTAIALVVTSGCVYRANIAQGNFLEESDLEQLEIGMTRNQVRFLIGTPMVDDPFQGLRLVIRILSISTTKRAQKQNRHQNDS